MGINRPVSPSASILSRCKALLVGRPLSSEEMQHERIPKWKALAVLSSDALSSVAYATEEVLIPLSLFAAGAVAWSLPIALAIAFLLVVVTISYQQTIDAYPNGGGAYTVAKENLGVNAGLVAGASLLIDYVLTVAVSVAAGVENMASALPFLAEHRLIIGVVIVAIIMVLNLRGIRESASIFAFPTYFFVFSFLILIAVGAWRFLSGQVTPVAPLLHESYPSIPVFLLLRAFSSGCSALTGIEAISNGVPVFRDPSPRNAKITMLWMSGLLGAFFLGITALAHLYGIVPKEGETAVSLLAESVFGRNGFYYLVQASTALILVLAANTSYADFPRLSSLLSRDGFLPRQLSSLGDRLVFSNGIIGLSVAAIALLVTFKGDTHLLIPLYAVGVFLSFTLSQSGMVVHHWRTKHSGWRKSLFFNLLGALTTLVVLTVIAGTKFLGGAWMVVVLIPILVVIFRRIKGHYILTARQLNAAASRDHRPIAAVKHTAIIPVSGIHPGVLEAARYALSISSDARACYVELNAEQSRRLQELWLKTLPDIKLVILQSPFRSVIQPVIDYVDAVERETDDDVVTVIIPEFVTERWYHKFLHNQTAILLYAALRAKREIVVTSVRYHLGDVD
ncbi:MAG: APC family permease [Bdellovibrionota bacterium]